MLLTGIEGDEVRLFDPYYCAKDHPDAYNRIVPVSYLERETRTLYALGPLDGREAVLLRNRRMELTEERTVEYVI